MIRDFLHAALATLLILGFYGAFLVVARLLTRERSEPRANLPGDMGPIPQSDALDAAQDEAMRLGNEDRCPIYDRLAAEHVVASAEAIFAEVWAREGGAS